MSTTETATPSVGERMKEAFGGMDMRAAMRLLFNKCPKCDAQLVRGYWLRYCADRTCQGYVGVLNKALGNKIDYVKPRTEAEEKALKSLVEKYADA